MEMGRGGIEMGQGWKQGKERDGNGVTMGQKWVEEEGNRGKGWGGSGARDSRNEMRRGWKWGKWEMETG